MYKPFLLLTIVAALATSGCSSFRTIALYRHSDDSIHPENSGRKLKGLPVKLKVPSHLLVTIYEEQVLLANSDAETTELTEKEHAAAVKVVAKETEISAIEKAVPAAKAKIAALDQLLSDLAAEPTPDPDSKKALDKVIAKTQLERAVAVKTKVQAIQELEQLPKLREQLAALRIDAEIASRLAAVGHTLVSFSPAQFHVDSELQYTDKVFLVDFKRPAGGILDLTEASMDDEQYFSNVQAEVTERTMQDISSALGTLGKAFGSTAQPNLASPISANSANTEKVETVSFQKSVIATKRFDISECGWEQAVRDFVDLHLGRPELLGTVVPNQAAQDDPAMQVPANAFGIIEVHQDEHFDDSPGFNFTN